MKIEMPAGAGFIITELNRHGYEAFIVGGCVRDALLGKTPNDWDITTSAPPEAVKDIFLQRQGTKTVDTGIQHGTVTVIVGRGLMHELTEDDTQPYAFEVTTYRVDGRYEDHRRPSEVTFTASLEEDLKRRDFTINAMAYNDDRGIIDIFGGRRDLEDGIIRCVGNPSERFDEDVLRILRAVRFAAQLGFKIDEPTRKAMQEQAEFLRDISAERIQVELTKLIMSDNPGMLVEAYRLGLTGVFLPEFDVMMQTEQNNPYHMYSVGMHTIKVMENTPKDMVLRYAALLHDVGKPDCKTTDEDGVDHFYGHQVRGEKMANEILRRLKLDNNTIDRVKRLVLNHDYGISNENTNIRALRRFLAKLGNENFGDFVAIRRADMAGQSEYKLMQRQKAIDELIETQKIIVNENQCLKISDLAINGKDLIRLGVMPGPELGRILKQIMEMVFDDPELNERDRLMELAKELI